MLCYVMLCYVMLCYVTLRYVMLRYVTLRYVMLCYVMLLDVWNLNTNERICGPYIAMLLFYHRPVCTVLLYCSLDIKQKEFSVPTRYYQRHLVRR